VRYFQRLANATPTERLLAGLVLQQDQPLTSGRSLRLLLSEPAHAGAVIRQAADLMQPPIVLRQHDSPEGADPAPATQVTAAPDELAKWARLCAEERLKARRMGGVAVAAASHNLAWTLALVAYGGVPLPF
jgi:hypothetical protein